MNAWGGAPQFGTLYGTPKWWCLELIARLKPAVAPDTAAAELNPVFGESAYVGIGQPDPKRPNPTIALKPARGIEGLDDEDGYRSGVIVLMVLVSLVLLIACVNVTTLLLARKSARQREFSLRLALGASYNRIFRQLLMESTLLVAGGAGLGWLFAVLATRALAVWAEIEGGLAPDGKVLLFTLVVSAVVSLFLGLAPLRQATQCSNDYGHENAYGRGSADTRGKMDRECDNGRADNIVLCLTGCRGPIAAQPSQF